MKLIGAAIAVVYWSLAMIGATCLVGAMLVLAVVSPGGKA